MVDVAAPLPRRLKVRISDSIRPSVDWQLDQEFAFTPKDDSCKDVFTIDHRCRRAAGHEGEHASGFRVDRVRWP